MPKTIEITTASKKTDTLVSEIALLPGVLSLSVQKNISFIPPGDVITVGMITRKVPGLMRFLETRKILKDPDTSVSITAPQAVISLKWADAVANDSNESTWEEIELTIVKGSNMTLNSLLFMFTAGAMAVAGVLTDTLHMVIAAMIIAPGFVPLLRIGLGFASNSGTSKWRGILGTVKGYSSLFLGAAAASLILNFTETGTAYMPPGSLLNYWTSVTPESILVSAAASVAGALLIASNRSVLTSGVMVALALIPTMAITALSIVKGNFQMAGAGIARWLIDAVMVTVFSLIVFVWKKKQIHGRSMRM